MSPKSYIELVEECAILPHSSTVFFSDYYALTWNGTTIGYVSKIVIEALLALPKDIQDSIQVSIDPHEQKLSLFQNIPTYVARCASAAILCEHWRKNRTFRVLDGWRSELYPVYGPGHIILWTVERSASALFGIVSFGVHLTAYTRSPDSSHGLKIWVPRRSKSKQTFAGMLDNSVAGGMAVDEAPLDCLVREAGEEAGLQEELVRNYAKACGTVTYTYISDVRAGGEVGLVQPECQFVYDMELPEKVIPTPNDSEVENFYLWELEEVQAALRRGEFKPNCALVLLDFFIRWNILTEENESDYEEIKTRIHSDLGLHGPHELLH